MLVASALIHWVVLLALDQVLTGYSTISASFVQVRIMEACVERASGTQPGEEMGYVKGSLGSCRPVPGVTA